MYDMCTCMYMYMYVCMYVTMYVCMYVHVCMYVCMYVTMYVHIYVCMYVWYIILYTFSGEHRMKLSSHQVRQIHAQRYITPSCWLFVITTFIL